LLTTSIITKTNNIKIGLNTIQNNQHSQ
jgi:hypothetical protein